MLLYIIAAAVAFVAILLAAYYSRRRKRQNNAHLKKSLIEEQSRKSYTATKDESQSFMYVDGDLAWKPPSLDPSSPHEIQPVNTMSTVSTGRFVEETSRIHRDEETIVGGEEVSTTSSQDSTFSFTEDHTSTPGTTPTSFINGLDQVDDAIISAIPSTDSREENTLATIGREPKTLTKEHCEDAESENEGQP
jgi:hypothetical protein